MDGTLHARDLSGLDRAQLEARLREAEETLDAIRNGDVDAVVVSGPGGQQVYTLENADRPYRVLIEQMQEGAVTLSDDGTVLYCNQRFARLAKLPRETILGQDMARFVAEPEREAFRQQMRLSAGIAAAAEFCLRADDGSDVPVNVSLVVLQVDAGLPRVICGVVTDLSHNRLRNQELGTANERLAREIAERERTQASLSVALDAAEMGSWDIDLATDTTRRSQRHAQIFGHADTTSDWGRQTVLSHVIAEDQAMVAEAFRNPAPGQPIELQARIRRASDGAIRWVQVSARTFYDNGQPVRMAGVVADVTDRRAVEDQLRQAQKMEAVGQLTGGIAHDFNNLLMVIGGSLEVVSRRVSLDDKMRRLVTAAQDGVLRGAKLTQQLLSFSRRQNLATEVVCVDDLIPSFEHLLDRALGETVKLKIERAPNTWYCRTDPHQLENAVLNLAINARDAMPGGGTLTLTTAIRRIDPASAARREAAAGDYVVVLLTDTGSGMSPDVLQRVFEPFFTTKGVGRGTGLGLSQVYGFAKQSGGFVTIDSEVGRGTQVSIHLPKVDQAGAAPAPLDLPLPEISGRGVVLLVDDDAGVRAATAGMLRELGYAVREADNGPAALQQLGIGKAVDLVLSDVVMPDGISGVELAREVAQRWPAIPVLLTSGYTAGRVLPDAGVNRQPVLRKPFTLSELGQSVIEAMSPS